jgi:hypothetical protein
MSRSYVKRNKINERRDYNENREYFRKLRRPEENSPKVIRNPEYEKAKAVYEEPKPKTPEIIKPVEAKKENLEPLKKEDLDINPKEESTNAVNQTKDNSSTVTGLPKKRTYKRNYKCEICGRQFANPQALKTHKMFSHPTVKIDKSVLK